MSEQTTDESADSIVETAKKRFKRSGEFYDRSRILASRIPNLPWATPITDGNGLTIFATLASWISGCVSRSTLTAQHCNQVINNIQQNRLSIKVSSVDSRSRQETAELLGGLIRNIQVSSAADDAHGVAAEHSIYGGGAIGASSPSTRLRTASISAFASNRSTIRTWCIIDPDCKELDKSDAQWGFVFEDITKEEFKQEYPGIDPESWANDERKAGWFDDENVRIADYYYLTYADETACLLVMALPA